MAATVAGLAAALGSSACSGECAGPGCAASWPAARLSAVRALPGEEGLTLRRAAEGAWIGALEEGSGWTAAAAGESIAIGQPEADRVVRVADRLDEGPVEPLGEWTGQAGDAFGSAVAVMVAADGTGDLDLWVGAPQADFAKGSVALFRSAQRDAVRTSAQADLVLVGGTPGDQLGDSVVRCADLTGDRRPELLVSAPWFAAPPGSDLEPIEPLAGAVFLVTSQAVEGRTGRLPAWEVATVWSGSERGEGAGQAMACDRDLDGDGAVDVAIGAPWAGRGDGAVYLLSGGDQPSGPLGEVATAVLRATEVEEGLGASLATLEVDGAPALAVGAPGWRAGTGRVHLYPGAQLAEASPRRRATFEPSTSSLPGGHYGRFLLRVDLDGDRQDDLAVGSPDDQGLGRNDFDSGRLWVWLGANAGGWGLDLTADAADLALRGQHPFERVGRALAVADPDGDGAEVLLVPTREADPARER